MIISTSSKHGLSKQKDIASPSGRLGASKILQTRCSPLPFLSINLMVAACANTWPPAGFFGSVMNMPPPGSAITGTQQGDSLEIGIHSSVTLGIGIGLNSNAHLGW